MTAEFFQEYLNAKPRKKILLYVANPNKLMTCQYLVKKHESMGDKIIIFSDNLFVLELYSKYLALPMISGNVPHHERVRILFNFENTNYFYLSSFPPQPRAEVFHPHPRQGMMTSFFDARTWLGIDPVRKRPRGKRG